MGPPGRLFQDQQFEVPQMSGCLIERVGYLRLGQPPDSDGHILYIKPVKGSWNRAFLDAGIAFWEDWGDMGPVPEETKEEADALFVDCSEQLASRVIKRAFAQCEADRASRIAIEFQDAARIELRHVDEMDWTSPALVVVHSGRGWTNGR